MHLVSAQAAPAASPFPPLPPGTRLVGKPAANNGVSWQLYEDNSTYLFGFVTDTGYISVADCEMAPRAEKSARRWCAAFVAEPAFERVGAEAFTAAVEGQPEPAPTPAPIDPLGTHWIAGWNVTTSEGRAGTFRAEVFHAVTGERGALDQDFTGLTSAKEALGLASIWAMQNACDGEAPRVWVNIPRTVQSDWMPGVPGPRLQVEPGVYEAESNPLGALSIRTPDGLLGIRPSEFERIERKGTCPELGCLGPLLPGTAGDLGTADFCPVCGWTAPIKRGREVSGWRIQAHDDRGAYRASLTDIATNEVGENIHAETEDIALTLAEEWARANPTLACLAQQGAAPTVDADQLAAEIAIPPASDEVAQLRAENNLLREKLAAAEARDAAQAKVANDIAEHAARRREIEVGRQQAVDHGRRLAEQVKENKAQVRDFDAQLAEHDAAARGLTDRQLTLALTVRTSVGAQAQPAVTAPAPAVGSQKWSFNACEFVIESRAEDTPQGLRFFTWIKGHRDATEGFGETYEQAAADTKNTAAIVFENCDPGQTTPSVDPAVRMPAKRGRKPKLGGHDIATVQDAVACQPFLDAALALGVTPQRLQGFCEKNGIALDKALPTAPAEKAPTTRGRKPKAVTK